MIGALEELRVLLVEPDPDRAAQVARILERAGARVARAEDGAGALAHLLREGWDAVVAQARLPDAGAAELLGWTEALAGGAPVIVVSARPSVEEAVEVMARGAADYRAWDAGTAGRVPERLARALRPAGAPPSDVGFLGVSEEAQVVRRRIAEVAPLHAPVLVTGESGAGKERVARAVHACGPRAGAPFVAVNCAAVPEALFEGELFGAARGAYTGAHRDRPGLAVAADGGTLFLDEIGELAPSAQAKLLRFLDDLTVRPLGAAAERRVDVRVVAATNRDLGAEAARGRFREDLRFRVDVLRVAVPPLRRRRADVPLLARDFAERVAGEGSRVRLSRRAIRELMACDWPGNARELQNVMARAVARQGTRIDSVAAELDGEAPGPPPAGDGRAVLEDLLRRHAGDLGAVARVLGVSVRTVQRRLARAGLRAEAYRNTLTPSRRSHPEPGSPP